MTSACSFVSLSPQLSLSVFPSVCYLLITQKLMGGFSRNLGNEYGSEKSLLNFGRLWLGLG